MTLNLTAEEREILLGLLEDRRRSIYHELHHTDTLDFKERLKREATVVEGLAEKIKNPPSA